VEDEGWITLAAFSLKDSYKRAAGERVSARMVRTRCCLKFDGLTRYLQGLPFLALLLGAAALPMYAQTTANVKAPIPYFAPMTLAVNPNTDKIYAVDGGGNYVMVIDGATNQTTPILVGSQPTAVAVNPNTNEIYVADAGPDNFGRYYVTVIDGATNVTTPLLVGTYPGYPPGGVYPLGPIAVAVDPLANKIYVANVNTNSVTVIDGATNNTTSIAVGTNPQAVALNSSTSKIFVADGGSNDVAMIDGPTNTLQGPILVGTNPRDLAVDPSTNQIYVANYNSNNVTLIDGALRFKWTIVAGTNPCAVAVNPNTNNIYVANYGSNNVTVIYAPGTTYTTTTVAVGANPYAVAVNPVTNQIYVANNGGDSVTMIDGATNKTTTIPVGTGAAAHAVAVNPTTNHIYVTDPGTDSVTVISPAPTTTTVTGNPNPVNAGSSVTFTANVATSGYATPSGTVTFNDGSTVLGTASLNGSGLGTFSTSALAIGTHSITAAYGADATNVGSTSAVWTETVNGTVTTLSSSLDPSSACNWVFFTATVTTTSGITPTGKVTFYDGPKVLATANLNSSAVATFPTQWLSPGLHSIAAVYAGDANNLGSTSPYLTQSVSKATTVTGLAGGPNPSTVGSAVTFSVGVTTSGFSCFTPTGTVTFEDGSTILGTGTLSSGGTTYTTSSLSVGQHSITAVYGGDTNNGGSTSTVLTEVVNGFTATTAVTSSTTLLWQPLWSRLRRL